MDKSSINKFVRGVQMSTIKHGPEILTGMGVVGMLSTVVLAVKVTPKAIRLIDEQQEFSQERDGRCLKTTEVVRAAWKCYIPSAVTGLMSISCLIGASAVNVKRNAALATAYALSDTALKEYQAKVVETVGVKKEQTVRDAVVKEKVENNPMSNKEVIITGTGETVCYDAVSGRYFKSDIEKLRKAENILNRRLMDEMYISLNEFYYDIGLPAVKLGDSLGWNINDGMVDLDFRSQLADDGTPCLVLDYRVAPKYNYV